MYIRIVSDICKHSNLSCASLFLDVVTAFASMLRRSVFDITSGDETWLKALHDFGFSQADVSAVYDTVVYLSSWDVDANCNIINSRSDYSYAHKLAKHWYEHTWMSLEGIEGVFLTYY